MRFLPWLMMLSACGEAPPPEWHADIQPLVATHCGACHVPGGAGPFSLQTYAETSAMGEAAWAAMDAGTMPPWPADPSCRDYQGSRALNSSDLAIFRAWLDAGAPEGEAVGEPVAAPVVATLDPTHTDSVPGFVSSAVETDEYRCFVLDMDIPETMFLEATQVVAGSPQVHHVLVYALDASARQSVLDADAAEEGPGYTCFGSPQPGQEFVSLKTVENGFPNQIGAWVPGQDPQIQPAGEAVRISAGSTVVLQVHYSVLGGEPAPDYTEFQAVLTTQPPDRLVRTVPLLIPWLEIPAGDPHAEVTELFKSYRSDSVAVTSLTSHMHLLGSAQQVDVVRADESRECALDIPEWDFNWQLTYGISADTPLVLQPGDGLELTCAYDNSAENQPVVNGEKVESRFVEWGDGTLDEMCMVYLSTVEPYVAEPDESELPCAGTEACQADCGDNPTPDCLLQCPDADAECAVCMLEEGIGCGLSQCALSFAVDDTCITSCLISTLMFGGSTGQCLADRCAAQYEPFMACAEEDFVAGQCNNEMNRCGWDL